MARRKKTTLCSRLLPTYKLGIYYFSHYQYLLVLTVATTKSDQECNQEYGLIGNVHDALTPQLIENWRNLLNEIHNPSFLHLPEWYAACLESYHPLSGAKRPMFVEVQRGGRPVAVFPLVYLKKRVGLINISVLELMWPTDLGVRDCVIADHEQFDHISACLLRTLQAKGIRWDLFSLPDISEHSTALRYVTSQTARRQNVRHHHFSARIRVEGDRQSSLSARMRKRLDNYYGNLSQKGDIQFHLARHDALTEELFASFLEVEAQSWKGATGTQTALRFDEKQRHFYQHLFTSGSEARMIASLSVNGRIIAANLCLIIGDTLNTLKYGYSDEYANDFPGKLLLGHLIEHYAPDKTINYIAFVTAPKWAEIWRPELLKVYEARMYNHTLSSMYIRSIDKLAEYARQIKNKNKFLQKWLKR